MAMLGLDVGSTGCKAMTFREDGTVLAHAYREYEAGESVYEMHGDTIWESVRQVLAECAARTKEPMRALSVSSFGESFVPVGRDGAVLAPTMLYTDPRGAEQCRRLEAHEQRIMSIAGVKPHPMYSLSKLLWLREERPEVFEAAEKFLFIGSFVIFRLTGEAVADYSLAARSRAFDVRKKEWSAELRGLAGVDVHKLPHVVPSGTPVGHVLRSVARELGLPGDALVVTGGHDQVCAAVGAGVLAPGVAVDGTGTVECITPAFDRPVLDPDFLNRHFACVPHAPGDMYVTYGFNFTGGALLKWYRDQLARYEAHIAAERGVSVYRLLDETGARSPTDLLVVPHFAGSGTPDMNEAARGAILGLRFDTDAPTIYRALLEGVTYEMAYIMEALARCGIGIHELRAVGGGAKSAYWLGIKAAVTGCRIVPLETAEAGIAGAAMLAGVAAGIYRDLREAEPYFVKTRPAVEPDAAQREQYAANYERYKRAREAISALYA